MGTDTNPDQNNISIAEIITHSHAMLRHAEAGEWEIVAEEEAKRRRLLNNYFSSQSNIAQVPNIEAAISELLQINDKLEALSVAARDDIRSALAALNIGRTAVNAYRDNAR